MQQAFPTYSIRRDEGGRWSWRFDLAEGETAAASQKSYASAQECIEAIRQLRGSNNLSLSGTLDDIGFAAAVAASEPRTEAQPPPFVPEAREEPLNLSKDQVIPQPEPEVVESSPAPKGARNLTSKKSEDVIITHLRRLQRESGT